MLCVQAAEIVQVLTGWPLTYGYFDVNPFDELDGWRPHAWNVIPDGRFYDATSSQFGPPSPVIVDWECPLYVPDMVQMGVDSLRFLPWVEWLELTSESPEFLSVPSS